jgi:hypothetical protein
MSTTFTPGEMCACEVCANTRMTGPNLLQRVHDVTRDNEPGAASTSKLIEAEDFRSLSTVNTIMDTTLLF